MSKKRQPTRWPNVVKYPDGTYYAFIKPLHGGDSKEVSLRTKKAMQVPDALKIAEMKVQKAQFAGSRLKFKDIVCDYFEERKKEWKPRTLQENRRIVDKYLLDFFGDYTLNDIDHNAWAAFAKKKIVKDYMNLRYVLTNVMSWAAYKNWVPPQPLVFKLPKHTRRVRRNLNPEEICACLKVVSGKFEIFVHLILFHGMRGEEATVREFADFNFQHGAIAIHDSKTNTARVIPLLGYTAALIERERADGESKYLFPHAHSNKRHAAKGWFRKAWARMLKDTGLKDITPHDFRATGEKYASRLKKFTETEREKMFGSSSDVQNSIYITEFHVEELRGLEAAMFDKAKGVHGLEEIIQSKQLALGKGWDGKEKENLAH